MDEYMELYKEDNKHILPLFKMELILDDDDNIQFYPAIEDLENIISHATTLILSTLQNVPTVQVILNAFYFQDSQ